MDGLLIIDKPDGLTSHDVVDRVRRILKTKRVGHTGTLDPFATGVMVILIGQATRLAQFLDKDEKEYEAVVQLGTRTDTGDRTGRAIPAPKAKVPDLGSLLSSVDWEDVFLKFRGEVMQVPPMFSAKKVGGKKMYELARKGEEIERRAVPVTIHRLELINSPEDDPSRPFVRIRVVCSAGTYIRTLAEDIGGSIGMGAHLSELRRTRAGRFDISRAITLKELGAADDASGYVIPMSEAVSHLPAFHLDQVRAAKTRNGLSSKTSEEFPEGEKVRMLDPGGNVVAIGEFDPNEKTVRPKVVFG